MYLASDIIRLIFLSPLLIIIALITAGVINKRFRGFFITLAVLLYLLSTTYGERALLYPLEHEYLMTKPNLEGINAVVILGGGINEGASDSKLSESAFKRFIEGFALAKSLNLPLIYSGGGQVRESAQISESDAALESAKRFGKDFGFSVPVFQKPVSGFCFVGEGRSNTTAENAFFSANIFHDAGIKNPKIALVTSASHLKRAEIMFTKYGFLVVPVAVDFKCDFKAPLEPSFLNLAPSFWKLQNSLSAFYEYLGLVKFYIWSK